MDPHDPAGCSTEEESDLPSRLAAFSSPSPPCIDPDNPLSSMLRLGPQDSPPWGMLPMDDDFLAGCWAEYLADQQMTTCSNSLQASPTRLGSINDSRDSSPQMVTGPAGVLPAQRQHQQPVVHDVGGSRVSSHLSIFGQQEIESFSPSMVWESCDETTCARGMSSGPTEASHAAVTPVVTQEGNPECPQGEMQRQIQSSILPPILDTTSSPAEANPTTVAPVVAQGINDGVLTAHRSHQQPVDHNVGGSRENKDSSPFGEEIEAWPRLELFESFSKTIFASGMSLSPPDFLFRKGNIFISQLLYQLIQTAIVYYNSRTAVTQGGNPEWSREEMRQELHIMTQDAPSLPSQSSILPPVQEMSSSPAEANPATVAPEMSSSSGDNAGGISVLGQEELPVRTNLMLAKLGSLLPQKYNEELVSVQKMLERLRLCSAQISCSDEEYCQLTQDDHCSWCCQTYTYDGFREERPEELSITSMAESKGSINRTAKGEAFQVLLCSSSQVQLIRETFKIRETFSISMILLEKKGIESENERVDLVNKDVEVEAGDMSRKRTEAAEAKSGLMSRQSIYCLRKRTMDLLSEKGTEDVNVEPGDMPRKRTEDVVDALYEWLLSAGLVAGCSVEPARGSLPQPIQPPAPANRTGGVSQKRKNYTPRKKSEAWNYFTPVMAEDSRVVKAAKCNHCQKELKMDKNATTSTLLRHVWDVHGVKLSKSYKFQMRASKKKKQGEASTHNQGLDQADAESPGVPHEVHNN
ncbi:hypothetical protein ACP70R_049733 [Stipagrostis hirtigluma subsp. patula]